MRFRPAILPVVTSFFFWGLTVFSSANIKAPEWIFVARRLTGESDKVRSKSLIWLRSSKTLKFSLNNELQRPTVSDGRITTSHFLAFDVITALQLFDFVPQLISTSLADETGFTYHTLNTLFNSENAEHIVQFYKKQLFAESSSVPAKMAVLDSLSRMGVELTVAQLLALKLNPSIELKSTVLNYIREMSIVKNKFFYNDLLAEFLRESSYEIKMQSLFILKELQNKKNVLLGDKDLACVNDPNKSIRVFCLELKAWIKR
jgi:hypothetical protein